MPINCPIHAITKRLSENFSLVCLVGKDTLKTKCRKSPTPTNMLKESLDQKVIQEKRLHWRNLTYLLEAIVLR